MKHSPSSNNINSSDHASTQAAAQQRRMKGHRRTQSNSEIDLKSFITNEHHKSSSDLLSMVDCHQVLSAEATRKVLEQQVKSQNTESVSDKQVLVETLDFTPPEQSNGSTSSMFNFGKKRNYSTGGSLNIYTPPAVKTVNFMMGDAGGGAVNRFDLKNEEFFVIPEHQNDLLQSLDFQTGKLQSFNYLRTNEQKPDVDDDFLNPIEEGERGEASEKKFGKMERSVASNLSGTIDSDRNLMKYRRDKTGFEDPTLDINQDLMDFENEIGQDELLQNDHARNSEETLKKLSNSMVNTSGNSNSSKPNSRYNYNLQVLHTKIQNFIEKSNNAMKNSKLGTPEKKISPKASCLLKEEKPGHASLVSGPSSLKKTATHARKISAGTIPKPELGGTNYPAGQSVCSGSKVNKTEISNHTPIPIVPKKSHKKNSNSVFNNVPLPTPVNNYDSCHGLRRDGSAIHKNFEALEKKVLKLESQMTIMKKRNEGLEKQCKTLAEQLQTANDEKASMQKSNTENQKKIRDLEENSRKNAEILHILIQILTNQHENLPFKINESSLYTNAEVSTNESPSNKHNNSFKGINLLTKAKNSLMAGENFLLAQNKKINASKSQKVLRNLNE